MFTLGCPGERPAYSRNLHHSICKIRSRRKDGREGRPTTTPNLAAGTPHWLRRPTRLRLAVRSVIGGVTGPKIGRTHPRSRLRHRTPHLPNRGQGGDGRRPGRIGAHADSGGRDPPIRAWSSYGATPGISASPSRSTRSSPTPCCTGSSRRELRPDCVFNALRRPGGRFVAELGGYGNVRRVEAAMRAALEKAGVRSSGSPMYFPRLSEYATVLETAGLDVRSAVLFDRPTPLEGDNGFRNWVKMFGRWALGIGPRRRGEGTSCGRRRTRLADRSCTVTTVGVSPTIAVCGSSPTVRQAPVRPRPEGEAARTAAALPGRG